MSNCVISVEENKEKILSADRKIGRETKERTLSPLKLVQDKKKDDYGSNVVEVTDDTKVEQKLEETQNTSDSGKEYDLEQQFEDTLLVSASTSNSKQKQTSTQRMKLKAHNIIANDKANVRPPSYFKLDRSTTLILQMLIDLRHSGELHNVVGKGSNSIVIHAHCYGKYHIYFPSGNAIKVYKLSNGIEKNNAIYNRVQRENEHLLILREQHFSNNTPHPVQKNKNVIMMSFIGSDQETAPSVTVLPSETLNVIYCEIVKEIETWYQKLGLIHGNLSANNILYWMDKLHFIGWSHSLRKDHPSALKKLMKDCQFVTKVPEPTGKLLQTSVVVPTSDHGGEPQQYTFGDKDSRVAFFQKVLALKLLQSLGVGGIMYCFVRNNFDFIVPFIVVGTLAHASTVALMAWCSRARRQSPYTYMFLVAHRLTFAIFIGAVTNGFILQSIFRAWMYLCVTMLAMLLYAVFSLHTTSALTAGICVCVTVVTHTVLYAMTVLLSYYDPFPILGFTIVAALECAYVGNELAFMSGACDVPYREPLGPTDYANAALNLHIDYYYFITKFLIPKCR